MEYYWELIQHDGTRIEIPPAVVDTVKRRWDEGKVIHTARQGSIPANQIKTFRPTEKPFSDQTLIDSVARAFNEQQLNPDGSIQAKWVKKNVTQDRWNKHYSHMGYRRIGDEGGMVTVAFKQPIHQINVELVAYCEPAEIEEIERRH